MATQITRSEEKLFWDEDKPSTSYGWFITHTTGAFRTHPFVSREEQELYVKAVRDKLTELGTGEVWPDGRQVRVTLIAALLAILNCESEYEQDQAFAFLTNHVFADVLDELLEAFEGSDWFYGE